MDVSRNGILVEEESSGNIDFVRNDGDHCPLSNNCCEGAGGPDTVEFDLWDDQDDFRISGFVRQSGGLCSLSNFDFVRQSGDLCYLSNWKDEDDFKVESIVRKLCINFGTMLNIVVNFMITLQVEHENF